MAAGPSSTSRAGRRANVARASVSFPRDVYETLEQLAREKKVSVAWIVRDAVERYVGDQWPLFGR